MRFLLAASLLSAILFSSPRVNAQQAEGLTRGAKGRYEFTHTSMAPSATKDQMYARMKPFIVDALDAADNFVQWDEAGHDSVTTVAFLELENSSGGDIMNQVVDCKARLTFRDGEVTLLLTGFNYSGIVEGKTYGMPLNRLNRLPYYAESFAMLSVDQALRELSEKMDAAAAGVGRKTRR